MYFYTVKPLKVLDACIYKLAEPLKIVDACIYKLAEPLKIVDACMYIEGLNTTYQSPFSSYPNTG